MTWMMPSAQVCADAYLLKSVQMMLSAQDCAEMSPAQVGAVNVVCSSLVLHESMTPSTKTHNELNTEGEKCDDGFPRISTSCDLIFLSHGRSVSSVV
jgi:hypothetical protein